MITRYLPRLLVAQGAAAFGLLLSLGLILPASAQEQSTAAPAPDSGASSGQAPVPAAAEEAVRASSDAAHTARAAVEERRAAHAARMEARQAAMRERAAAQGIDMPEPPPLPAAPGWLSYEEMQAAMRRRGIEMPSLPKPTPTAQEAASGVPSVPAVPGSMASPPLPFALGGSSADQKRVFEVIEAMTPEQQEACFAVSRWHAASLMQPRMRPRMQAPAMRSGPGYGPSFRPDFAPGQRMPGQGRAMMPQR